MMTRAPAEASIEMLKTTGTLFSFPTKLFPSFSSALRIIEHRGT